MQPRVLANWRIVHYDFRRDVYTMERTRRLFKGAYRVLSGADLGCAHADGWRYRPCP